MENLTLISQSFYYHEYLISDSVQSKFYYFIAYCTDPSSQIDYTTKIFDYNEDSAIAGSSVTFGYSISGHTLIGSNISFLCE